MERMSNLQLMLSQQATSLTLVLGYGDSADGTGDMLREECSQRFDSHLIDVSHGGKYYGSVVHPQRFKQLAGVYNQLWANIPEYANTVSFIESDLSWTPRCLSNLVEGLQYLENKHKAPILLSPRIHLPDGRFYDTWAFVRNGRNFINRVPHHRDLVDPPHYLEMESVGSFVIMNSEIARKLHWPEEDVIVGLCRMAKGEGARIFMDTHERVIHP
jgi:hypothetical protein